MFCNFHITIMTVCMPVRILFIHLMVIILWDNLWKLSDGAKFIINYLLQVRRKRLLMGRLQIRVFTCTEDILIVKRNINLFIRIITKT